MDNILLKISSIPLAEAVVIIVIIPSAVLFYLRMLIRPSIERFGLSIDNSSLSIQFNSTSLIYALLLTFATLTVWDKFSSAQTAVIEEAASARAMFFLLTDGTEEERSARESVKEYLLSIIEFRWPQLSVGKDSPVVRSALQNLYQSTRNLENSQKITASLTGQLFGHIDKINSARHIRISVCKGIVPTFLWCILVFGALITAGYLILLEGSNDILQSVISAVTFSMLAVTLLMVVNFDHPFGGVISVSEEPYNLALKDMGYAHR